MKTNADDARAEDTYRQALDLYRRGLLKEAGALCERVLQFEPQAFDASHLLGVIAIQENRPQQAVTFIENARSFNPRSASAHNNHGNAFLEL